MCALPCARNKGMRPRSGHAVLTPKGSTNVSLNTANWPWRWGREKMNVCLRYILQYCSLYTGGGGGRGVLRFDRVLFVKTYSLIRMI